MVAYVVELVVILGENLDCKLKPVFPVVVLAVELVAVVYPEEVELVEDLVVD